MPKKGRSAVAYAKPGYSWRTAKQPVKKRDCFSAANRFASAQSRPFARIEPPLPGRVGAHAVGIEEPACGVPLSRVLRASAVPSSFPADLHAHRGHGACLRVVRSPRRLWRRGNLQCPMGHSRLFVKEMSSSYPSARRPRPVRCPCGAWR